MNKESRIYISGHSGLVGSALIRKLNDQGYKNLLIRGRSELDLTSQPEVEKYFQQNRPEIVYMAAAKVGGILANSKYPADFIRDNLAIQLNTIDAAYRAGTKKLVFLGSSCIYPRDAEQPISEESLLTGPLEGSNEWYAVAKIAGIKMCQAYRRQYGMDAICLMPTNLYGPGDNFDLETSHVLPALIRKFHEAKQSGSTNVTVWGTGSPRREFLYVEDLADAAIYLTKNYSEEGIINVGTGLDITIRELALMVSDVIGFNGDITFDPGRPDGTPRKVLDVGKLSRLGWGPQMSLRDGIRATYDWYKRKYDPSDR